MAEILEEATKRLRRDGSGEGDTSRIVNISNAVKRFEAFRDAEFVTTRVRSDGAVLIKPVRLTEIEMEDDDE
jgi:hypothetical protein